jgi:hypothetical protein
VREIRRRRALLPTHLRRDPASDIGSLNWDSFSRWELRPDWRTGYLGDADWDRNWEPVVSSDDDEFNEDKDYEDDAKTAPPPSPPRVSGEVSGQIYNGRMIRDDTDDMTHHVVYHYFQAADRGEAYQMPPELTEEEELAVVVLIGAEEERRAERRPFFELADIPVLSMAPPPPPGPPPMQLPRTLLAMPCQEARAEPWDAWPGGAPGWPAGALPILGWAPGKPTPPPTRGSTAAHSQLAMAAGALHRPLRR